MMNNRLIVLAAQGAREQTGARGTVFTVCCGRG